MTCGSFINRCCHPCIEQLWQSILAAKFVVRLLRLWKLIWLYFVETRVKFIYVRKMFCEKAFELIKELHRSPDSLPLFNVRFLCIRRYPLQWLLTKGVTRNQNPNISLVANWILLKTRHWMFGKPHYMVRILAGVIRIQAWLVGIPFDVCQIDSWNYS